ncbi:MAG: SDR family NAD(P)-dependent oxidoreductase [Chloroflexi bacterium]|nr:SDR family NAD(P)-dependent oxidoreductase [Chloroflexota bacterium]
MARYELAGRTIAITGSTGGLGSALASELRSRGANIALMDLGSDALARQAISLGGPDGARAYEVDVRHLSTLEAAMDAAAAEFGHLDVVIAGAGVEVMSPMALANPKQFEQTIDINLTGVWRTFRAALPHVQSAKGYLLAISSMAAFVHSPLQAPYTASKAGVWAMSDSIRLEVRHLGVDVGTIHPTFFRTPMMDRVLANPAGRRLWGEHKNALWKMVPLELVVAETVAAIERRAAMTVIPRRIGAIARAAGFARPLIDRIGWPGDTIEQTIDLVTGPT